LLIGCLLRKLYAYQQYSQSFAALAGVSFTQLQGPDNRSSRIAQSGERSPPIPPDRHGNRVRTAQPGGRRKGVINTTMTDTKKGGQRPPFFVRG
jgi:hypothetical protein